MTTKEDGGPAFAQAFAMSPKLDQGMSLRDYFAAKAMPAIYADYVSSANQHGYCEDWRIGVAIDAYEMADAMLKARGQGGA